MAGGGFLSLNGGSKCRFTLLPFGLFIVFSQPNGGVQEWLNWHAWKVCILERVSRVRIPSPPQIFTKPHQGLLYFSSGQSLLCKAREIQKPRPEGPGFVNIMLPLKRIAEGNPIDSPKAVFTTPTSALPEHSKYASSSPACIPGITFEYLQHCPQ